MNDHTMVAIATSGPSPHLSWTELACHDPARTPYPQRWRKTRAAELARAFEAIREACGEGPIRVTSAYRTLKHNRSVGSKDTSQHPEARAADLEPPKYMGVLSFHAHIVGVAKENPGLIGGIGFYPTFVHIDTRHTPRLIHWHGSRKKADSA